MSVQNLDSVKVKWVIQGVEIKAAPNAWPINSLPWMTYEFELNKPGNEEEDFPEEYVINDEENLDKKSVELVRDVVTRNVTVGRIASNEPQRPGYFLTLKARYPPDSEEATPFQTEHEALLRTLDSKGWPNQIEEVGNIGDIQRFFENPLNRYLKQNVGHLVIRTHGNCDGIYLSKLGQIIVHSLDFYILARIIREWLMPKASVFIHACSAGQDVVGRINFCRALANEVPGHDIYCADGAVGPNTIDMFKFLLHDTGAYDIEYLADRTAGFNMLTFRTDPDEKFFEDIRPMDVTWTDLGKTTSYLFPGVGIDYIYPLFLSREDRIYWYEQCRFRKNYVCRAYSPDDYKIQDEVPVYNAQDFWTIPSLPSPYTIIETKLTQSWPTKNRDIFISTKFEDLHKDINELRKNNKIETRKYLDLLNRLTNLEILEGKKWETISELLDKLSKVNNLLVAGGFALAFFRDRQKTNQWKDIDIFAYGDKAINNIEHAVTICLKFVREKIPGNYDENNVHYDAEANASMYDVPVRTKYAITIPIYDSDDPWNPSFTVQFILIKSRNIHEILSRFDLDCCAIGFKPSTITEFYLLNRTVRALKTMTNVIDPTRQSPTYAQRLKKYVARGFEVAVPGLIEKELCVNAQSLTSIARGDLDSLSGLSKLIIVLIFNLTQNRRQRGDYDHITSSFALPLLAKFYFDKIHNNDNTLIEVDFVVGDILNSTNKVRTIGYWSNRMMRTISYKPSNFKIELLENGTQFDMIGSIHQTTTPFYAGYFDSNCLSFTPRRRSPEVDL